MAAREEILTHIRASLGRANATGAPAGLPPALLRIPEVPLEKRIEKFTAALEKLNGVVYRAHSREDARAYVERLLNGRSAVTSNAPFLNDCGIPTIANVRPGGANPEALREMCATLDAGISSADYALSDTGSLVMLSSHEEARLVSLLPPLHIALVPLERMLTGLDELYTLLPVPSDRSSSMVFITGPSRTADIEQILIRGVHGPGEIHVVLV
ncbi:MAG: lactate utilization protein [Bryobacterales bacterium]|nr:lactate utilization protein [Bryobacterales bacterium]